MQARAKDQIHHGDEVYDLAALDTVLLSHPAIQDAAAFAVEQGDRSPARSAAQPREPTHLRRADASRGTGSASGQLRFEDPPQPDRTPTTDSPWPSGEGALRKRRSGRATHKLRQQSSKDGSRPIAALACLSPAPWT